jgi:hypothetical protein
MIKFTALLRLSNTDEATLANVKETLMPLKELDSVSDMDVRFDERHTASEYDVLHLIWFETWDDLNEYMAAPEHNKAMEYILTVRTALATLAYEE